MPLPNSMATKSAGSVRSHGATAYFALTFTISWLGAFAVAAPHLFRHEAPPKITGILMFPLMLLGPSISGLLLTKRFGGKEALRGLLSRMTRWHVSPRWYAPLLIPPVLVLAVLCLLRTLVSPAYAPNWFVPGILFAVPAGFLEEIGWMGYAFPRMKANFRGSAFRVSVLLGLLWSAWHLPVINYLGTATPHGSWWFPFFLAFAAAMTAMRVLICWIYTHTESVLLCQLMHISSTGSLVIFSAPRVAPRQEAAWYAIYAAVLWAVAAFAGRDMVPESQPSGDVLIGRLRGKGRTSATR
jgi:uncharacterized protein